MSDIQSAEVLRRAEPMPRFGCVERVLQFGAWLLRKLPGGSVPSLLALVVGTVWGLAFAPEDFKQGNSFRIIYIHVPSAFISLAGYYLMAIAGAISLIWRIKLADIVLRSCAPIGAAMTFVAAERTKPIVATTRRRTASLL